MEVQNRKRGKWGKPGAGRNWESGEAWGRKELENPVELGNSEVRLKT